MTRRLSQIARAYPTMLRVGLAEAVAYRVEFLVWVLTTTLPLIMLALWSAAAADGPVGPPGQRFGQHEFVAYYLAALIVRQMSGSWVIWELNMEIRQGVLPLRMMRPIHPLLAYSAESLAAIPMRAAIAVPLALVMLAGAGSGAITRDPLALLTFSFALAGAWLLQFSSMALIGSLGLFIESAVAVYELWLGLFAVLSGYLVPLELFPRWVAQLSHWLPFRYMLGFPVEVLTARLGRGAALGQLALQWAFGIGFAISARGLFQVGLRRYQAYGG
jgi:ABC-2 type transport system permease protein